MFRWLGLMVLILVALAPCVYAADAPAPAAATWVAPPVVTPDVSGDDMGAAPPASPGYVRALMKAGVRAHRDGTITRWQLWRLKMARFHPELMAEAQACCVDAMEKAGIADSASASAPNFAWDVEAIIAFITALLPIIMQIIEMFSNSPVGLVVGLVVPFGIWRRFQWRRQEDEVKQAA